MILDAIGKRDTATTLSAINHEGANLKETDGDGDTPLHLAVRYGQYDVVVELCRRGADPFARNNAGKTPAKLAEELLNIPPIPSIEQNLCEVRRIRDYFASDMTARVFAVASNLWR